MSSKVRNLKGFAAIGSEVPYLDPFEIRIVGLDVPATPENWFAHCPRLDDVTDADLAEYVADIMRANKVDAAVDAYKDGDCAVLLDGRRTTRAARLARSAQAQAGVKVADRVKVRVLLHTGTPEQLYRINRESHKQQPLTPAQIARGYLMCFNSTGEDTKRVAELCGVTEQTVKNQLNFFNLSTKLQGAVGSGFALAQAIKLVDLPRAEQDEKFAALEAAGALRGAAATNGIRAAKEGRAIEVDRSKMRPRALLEKWLPLLRKVDKVHLREIDPVALIKFILGGPLPGGLDEQVTESLEKAGYKTPARKEKRA